jgi:hypothetical protein
MIVVIHTDSLCAMIAPFKTRMSSLTETLLINFIFSLDCVFSLVCKRQDDIVWISGQSPWFGVWTIRMAHMTVAHVQTKYHVS